MAGRRRIILDNNVGHKEKNMNGFKPFEKSKKDVEVKGKGREGSKKEEAMDKKMMKKMPAKKKY